EIHDITKSWIEAERGHCTELSQRGSAVGDEFAVTPGQTCASRFGSKREDPASIAWVFVRSLKRQEKVARGVRRGRRENDEGLSVGRHVPHGVVRREQRVCRDVDDRNRQQ